MPVTRRRSRSAVLPEPSKPPAPTGADGPTKMLLIPFDGESDLDTHPALRDALRSGWSIRSTALRLVETAGLHVLVVLSR